MQRARLRLSLAVTSCVVAVASLANAQIPSNGLVARWQFDEGTGIVAGDSSGRGHDGTLVNGPAWAAGIMGGALTFDGIDDYVSIPDSVDFDFGSGDFSICAWFRTTVDDSERYIIDFFRDGNFPHIEIYTSSAGRLGSHLCTVDPLCTRITNGHVAGGGWRHVTITLDNSAPNGYEMYVDGVKEIWATFSGALDGWDTVSIAARVHLDGTIDEPWSGDIDDVLLYNRVLSDLEIADLYTYYPVELQSFVID